jgi:chromosome segregation ATPase
MAVKAMDAADESWSIEDPLADAAAKTRALSVHAQQLQADLQAMQTQTQTRLDAIAARQEQVVGDIRKQINELEALVARELSRAAADTANQQADLKAAQDQTARALGEIAQLSQRLQSLSGQFGTTTQPSKE